MSRVTDSLHFMRWDWILSEMIWAFEQKVDNDADSKFFDHSEYKEPDEKTNHDKWFKDLSEGSSKVKYDREGHAAWQERKANGGQIPEHLKANQERIARMKKQFKDYKGSDEFDNGYRDGSSYNHETDPFYMEEQP